MNGQRIWKEGDVASLAFPALPQQKQWIPFGQPEAGTIRHFHTNREQWLSFQGFGLMTYRSLKHDPSFAI